MALSTSLVHARLRESAQKLRVSLAGRWLLGGAAGALAFLVVFLLLDAWLHLGAQGRWMGFGLIFGALGAGVTMAVRASRRVLSDEAMARRIEKAADGSGNVLISAVQFDKELAESRDALTAPGPKGVEATAKTRAGVAVREAIFQEMKDPFPAVKWDQVFDARLLKRLGMVLAGVFAVMAIWAVAQPGYFSNSAKRLFMPGAKIAALTRTTLDIYPGEDQVVPHGRRFEVKATLGGTVPAAAWLHFREAGSSWQKTLMTHDAGQPNFAFEWKEVKQPLEYYVEAGDARSGQFALGVRPRTALKSKTATIAPPAYVGRAASEVRDFANLQNVTPGSTIEMALEFNNPVTELTAKDEKGADVAITRNGETGGRFTLKPMSNQTIKLSFTDTLGAVDTLTLPIGVKVDDAPRLTVTDPAEGAQLVAAKGAKLTIKFRAEDAFALGSVQLFRSTEEKEDAVLVQDFPAAAGKAEFESAAQVTLNPAGTEDRLTFRLVAKDKNDVSGPGVTMSRPIVVSLQSADKLAKALDEAAAKLTQGIDALIKLQVTNLEETKAVALRKEQGALGTLVGRQVQIGDGVRQLAVMANAVSPDVRNELVALAKKELPEAIAQLRNADAAKGAPREKFLASALVTEAMILARLQGAPTLAEDDKKQQEITELISGVEDLLKREREILTETKKGGDPAGLGERQDALADKAAHVRTSVEADSKKASIGDTEFRNRLAKVASEFTKLKIYEDMLAAAEKLGAKQVPPAVEVETRVVKNLATLVEMLNAWQLADAAEKADDLKKKAQDMQGKLDKLAEIQREILEKTKDMARKAEFRPEDVATAKEFAEQKDLMKDVLEQLTTDLQAFPETKAGNEMKGEIVSIFEDVQQADKQDVAGNKLKPQEIAVQKEQGLLDAIEQAKKIAADMEMWLPSKTETQKWLMENFDKTEMPEIPMLPLADVFEDLVGKLMDEQQDINEEIQDPASNQAMAMNPANGWEVRDGPMPGFGAQGRSGNERPNHNEQMGRSSGGREGMSDGEMAAGKTQNLEGDTPTTRRTRDAMQQGQVEDEGGIGKTRATGGGKAGGFSDRQGMEGNAPLRATTAAARPTDAAAAAQAQLAEKASKKVAEANLLYIRGGDQLAGVAKLMDENAQAIREGRMKDAAGIHQRIMGRLKEIQGGVASSDVLTFAATDGARGQDKQLLGGQEGEAPGQYKEQVADYFRSLVEEK